MCALMGVVGVGVFAALYQHIRSLPRINLPKHMLGHPVVYKDQLISPEQGDSLRQLFRDIAPFPTNNADLNFYKTVHEHIGEAVPMGEDGSCPHHYLLPSRDGTLCHLPGRIDIGRHFIKTGGARGLRETFDVMKSRLMSFGSYNFNLTAYPQMSDLFTSPSFTEAAQKVCPADKKHLDPFQFNFIVNLPGQSVATHVDGVYFWGASRFQVPQWLLAAMKFSGLWEDVFVDQVQVVGYLHKWDPTSFPHHEDAGQFLYWDSNDPEPKVVQPKPLAGSVVDGSKTIHSAAVYRVGSRPPVMQKGRTHYLAHVEGEDWVVQSQADGGDIIANYTFDDLRISIVYRARCFADEEEAARFRAQMEGPTGEDGRTTLEQILSTFVENLITRGVYQEGTTLDDLDRFSLATTILDTYIAYPLPNNRDIPLNYCALPRELPWTAPFINLICP